MRIDRLHFERYGHFTDRRLLFSPQAALHVVVGANEAGKTSALSGIGDLLFGFPHRIGYDFRHPGRTLRLGGVFSHSDGRKIAARRRRGDKNTLFDDAENPLADDVLTPLLGDLTRDAFSREFGLTARALRDGGAELLSAGGRLAETLAASSAGMTGLTRVRDRLLGEADGLFSKTRSGKREFYIASDRYTEADKALRDAVVTRDAMRQLQDDVAAAAEKRAMLGARHAQSVGTLALWQRTWRVREHLAQLDGLAAELAPRAHLPAVSAQTLADWRNATDSDAALGRQLAALDEAAATAAAEIAGLDVDDALLVEGSSVDALRERLGGIRDRINDLPKRRQSRDSAQATLGGLAQRLGLSSHTELLALIPTDSAQAQARDLIERTRGAEQAIGEATARLTRAQQERTDLAVEQAGSAALVDIERLHQRFEALGDVSAQADRHRLATAALAIEFDALAADAASLDPTPGSLERLRALPVPEHAVIAKYADSGAIGEAEIRRLGDAIARCDAAIATANAELTRLSSAGEVPTRGLLAETRRARDAHLDGLRSALDGDRQDREARLADVIASSATIDTVTDRLLTDAERAALYDAAQRDIATSGARRAIDAAKRASIEAELGRLDVRWRQEWVASGIVPRGRTDMLRWRERLDDILVRLGRLDAQKTDIAALAAGLLARRAAVAIFLVDAGRTPEETSPVDMLYREAKARFEALQGAFAEAKVRAASLRRIDRDIGEAQAARQAGEAALTAAQQAWPAAMAGIGRSGDTSVAEARATLAAWREVPVPAAAYDHEGHRVLAMEADLRIFDQDVFETVVRLAPDIPTDQAQDALLHLGTKLAEARRDSEAVRQLQLMASKRAAQRSDLVARRAEIAAVLDEARRRLALDPDADLGTALDQLAARHAYEAEQASLRRALHAIGDGRDEAALRAERAGLDLDVLPSRIAGEDLEQRQIIKEMEDAAALHHQCMRDLDERIQGRDAAGQAAKRAEAGADLLSIAERWLLRSAAAKLASRAIERHRAMVQDPLIARASDLFATATGTAFAGLGVNYGEDGEPVLMARRGNGDRVKVSELSEGTRDQLFLALRLALLERRTSEPMPFIGDDLLASFDDDRTLATLRLLATVGRQRQVILFTHHQHVVDLARSLPDHVDVVAL